MNKTKRPGLIPLIYLGVVLVAMYIPIALVIIYSFNASRISSVWSGWTLRWYADLFRDRAMFQALMNSIVLGLTSSVLAAVIGTLGAVGISRKGLKPQEQKKQNPFARFGSVALGLLEYIAILPIMTPEIILGMVLLVYFSLLALPAGMLTLVLAHTSFCIPYVYLLVKARLAGLDKSYTEAARDLGASGARAFFDITLPLIAPAVVSGMMLAFAMSFDDVIISSFVTGPRTNTLPVLIYSQMKTGVTPKTNALCTLVFAATLVLGILSALLARPPKGESS
jgi:spermidine/putrescine transport system permease protein